jgi:hypothetical protein
MNVVADRASRALLAPRNRRAFLLPLLIHLLTAAASFAQLDQTCTVSALDRTAQGDANGVWVLTNVPVGPSTSSAPAAKRSRSASASASDPPCG